MDYSSLQHLLNMCQCTTYWNIMYDNNEKQWQDITQETYQTQAQEVGDKNATFDNSSTIQGNYEFVENVQKLW